MSDMFLKEHSCRKLWLPGTTLLLQYCSFLSPSTFVHGNIATTTLVRSHRPLDGFDLYAMRRAYIQTEMEKGRGRDVLYA